MATIAYRKNYAHNMPGRYIEPGKLINAFFDVPLGNNFALYHSPNMSSNPKTNEWNLLKEEFDALVHSEGVRQDNLGEILDGQIRRRFGELIAWAAGHKAN